MMGRETAGKGLRWIGRSGPGENLRQQSLHQTLLIVRLKRPVAELVCVVRLVPHIPGEYTHVSCERADHSLHIGFETRILRRILQRFGSWALYPARVVDSGLGRMLRSQLRIRIPAGIEQHENSSDMVLIRDREVSRYPCFERVLVLLPEQVVQEYAHGVHAEAFGPT